MSSSEKFGGESTQKLCLIEVPKLKSLFQLGRSTASMLMSVFQSGMESEQCLVTSTEAAGVSQDPNA